MNTISTDYDLLQICSKYELIIRYTHLRYRNECLIPAIEIK